MSVHSIGPLSMLRKVNQIIILVVCVLFFVESELEKRLAQLVGKISANFGESIIVVL